MLEKLMNVQINKPFIVLGAGGHAKVVIDMLETLDYIILGVSDQSFAIGLSGALDVPLLGNDLVIMDMNPADIYLAMGIGSIGNTINRIKIFDKFSAANFIFPALIHSSAVVSSHVCIGDGSQIMAGAVIQTHTSIGKNCIINTNASIDHDCEIANGVHIAPGSVLSGDVHVGNGVHIGTGAKIINSINIGDGAIIGAGAIVLKDVPAGTIIRSSENSIWNG